MNREIVGDRLGEEACGFRVVFFPDFLEKASSSSWSQRVPLLQPVVVVNIRRGPRRLIRGSRVPAFLRRSIRRRREGGCGFRGAALRCRRGDYIRAPCAESVQSWRPAFRMGLDRW